jgi:Rod binding domain-containing protein
MLVPDANAVHAAGTLTQSLSGPSSQMPDSVDAQKLKKAAGDFESILLASMWKSMKQSFGTAEAETDPAHGTLDDWGIEIMSGAVGRAGGLGIGRLILKHLEPALKGQPAESHSDSQVDSGKKK